MQPNEPSEVKFEIGHVLFIDIVGYSKMLINQQSEQLETLRKIVRGTEQFRLAEAEGKLLRLPTGDGGALVFRNSPEAPVLCALEISRELKNHPELKVRMGIHSGPVNAITDLNEQANIAGAGINYAQRVMDCGDAGHILLSRHLAEDLEAYPRWQPHLHDLGQTTVKHGVIVSAVNLYTDDAGNSAAPERFRAAEPAVPAPTPPKRSSTVGLIAVAAGAVGALALLGWLVLPALMRSRVQQPSTVQTNESLLPHIAAKSIAVLPFENLSSDKENAYFADGIQDEILTRLSKIAALKVISRTSTQKYKSAPDNLREVGKQLGVAHLLEGSVQKIANAVHVNVQLIRAATDEHLWAESYNRKLDDVFAVEGEVATAIAEQLNAKLTGAEQKAVTDKPTQNPAAYDAYLRAISAETTRTDDASLNDETNSLTRATQLDPQFALAWARLAVARSRLYFNGIDPATNTAASVKEAADRALAVQPELGEAHIAQGVYRYRVLRDFKGALESYGEALKRMPNNAYVLEQMALVERRLGQWTIAEDHYQRALELDPKNLDYLTSLAVYFGDLQKFAEAQSIWDRVLQVSPGDEVALASKALLYQQEGRLNESARELGRINGDSPNTIVAVAKFLQLEFERRYDETIAFVQQSAPADFKNDARAITSLGWLQLWAGHKDEARATLQRAVSAIQSTPDSAVPVDSRILRSFLAWTYAGLGEKEKALEEARRSVTEYETDALEKPRAEIWLACIQGYFGDTDSAIAALQHLLEVPGGVTPGQLRFDPIWDPLRKDPRFQKLCEQPH